METQENNSTNTPKVIAAVVVIAAVIVLVAWFMKKDTSEVVAPIQETTQENIQTPTTQQTPAQTPTQSETPTTSVVRKYTDGSFSANGKYSSPAGNEEIGITLVIKDDKVTSATFEGKATNPTSQFMQNKFDDGFETAVVGKSLDELSLTVVNGSSLTPKGFMDALQKIKADAIKS